MHTTGNSVEWTAGYQCFFAHLEHVLYSTPRVALDDALDPNEWFHLRVQAVTHELELAVGRDERYRAVILKAREPNALVEFHILHLDGLATRCPTRCLEHDLVVQA